MKTAMYYDAVKEVKEKESPTKEEIINLVDNFYIFHAEKTSKTNRKYLSGVVIRGNMLVRMEREERPIPYELHAPAIESGLILYQYVTKGEDIPYVLSKNAAADLFCEMGVAGRMAKIPFVERDLYLATLMDYYKGTYKPNIKAIIQEFEGVRYVIALRKPSFVINSFNNLLKMIGEIVDEDNFDLVEYHINDGVEFHLLSERDEYKGFCPAVQIYDNPNGNTAFTVKGGYQTTQGIFINVSEIKQIHKSDVDYEDMKEKTLAMMSRIVRSLKRLQQEDINCRQISKENEMNVSEHWKDVEAVAAMKKNKRAETSETLKEKQENATEVGDRVLLFLNAANSFDYTNEKLEKALGSIFAQMMKSIGITKKEVDENASL